MFLVNWRRYATARVKMDSFDAQTYPTADKPTVNDESTQRKVPHRDAAQAVIVLTFYVNSDPMERSWPPRANC